MIRYNDSAHTLVEVGDWQDMYDRAGFIPFVAVAEGDLAEILAQYTLNPPQPCGISTCRTPHNRGYLVQLKNGLETNIGNVCGKKHFGIDFNQSRNAFQVAVNSQRYRAQVQEVQNRIPVMRSRIVQLRQGEYQADDCYSQMDRYMKRLFDERTSRKLELMARADQGQVLREAP